MKNFLFFVGSYETKASANGVCTKKIVEELSKNNKVYVISEKRGRHDYTISKDKNVEIYKYWRNLSSYFSEKYGMIKFSRFLWYIYQIIYFLVWPLTSPFLVKKFVRKFKKINQINKIDTIIAVHNSLENCIAGCIIKKKNPNIKLYLYNLDAISGGYVLRSCPQVSGA